MIAVPARALPKEEPNRDGEQHAQPISKLTLENNDVFTGDSLDHLLTRKGSADIPGNNDWRQLFSRRFEDRKMVTR